MLLGRPTDANWTILPADWLSSIKNHGSWQFEFVDGSTHPYPSLHGIQKFYIPVNIPYQHWLVACVDMSSWTMTLYNSLPSFCELETQELLAFLDSNFPIWVAAAKYDMGPKFRQPPFNRIYPENVPVQSGDLGDCGVWTCIFLDRLTKGQDIFVNDKKTSVAMEFRWDFAKILYENKTSEEIHQTK
ncbi:uncharacterized protein LOC143578746 [Bidens hawaiensis]|uniref:uncharacterized protein LOC143578746 n=1 Tax=Bidens hawaiensis TaxID=980011 RepID=UPI00404ACC39